MTPLEAIGWLGQACFFSRFFVQWLVSEREKRSVAPPVFWWISLFGATALGTYLALRGEYVLLLGQAIGGSIALRNLAFVGEGERKRVSLPVAVGFGLVAWAVVLKLGIAKLKPDLEPLWLGVAICGQTVWTSRFIVQWIATERRGESHFPRSFWWISLVGNSLLLAYTISVGDPILIAGFVPGPLVQIRNLMLGSRSPQPPTNALDEPAPDSPSVSAVVVPLPRSDERPDVGRDRAERDGARVGGPS